MIIRPAERDLQHLMKASEGIVTWDGKEPGDCRVRSRAETREKKIVFWWRHLLGLRKSRFCVHTLSTKKLARALVARKANTTPPQINRQSLARTASWTIYPQPNQLPANIWEVQCICLDATCTLFHSAIQRKQ
jgi:hypothetical protein